MVDGLFNFWTIRSRFQEGELHFGQSVAAWSTERNQPALLASLQARLAWCLFQRGQAEPSRQSLAVYEEIGSTTEAKRSREKLEALV